MRPRPVVIATCALLCALRVLSHGLRGPVGTAGVDALGSWWFQWWVSECAVRGDALTHTNILFFPWGKDVLLHTGGNVLDALFVAPARVLFGGVAAWNALAVATISANGFVAGMWARARRASVGSAIVLGALQPLALHELTMGRPTQAILAPLILTLWATESRRPWRAGVALALTGWFYWYYALFGALAMVWMRPGWRRLAISAVVSLALTAPVVISLLSAVHTGEAPGLLPVMDWLHGSHSLTATDGGDVRLGALDLLGRAVFPEASVEGGSAAAVVGIVTFLAALFGPARWLALAAAAFALGPFPGGNANPVYIGLAAVIPPMARLYWPVRMASVIGIAALWPRRRGMRIFAVLAVVETLVRGWAPLPTWTPTTPGPLVPLARADGAILVLPYGWDQWPLVWQTVHGKPMFNGMHERSPSLVPHEQQSFRERNSFVKALIRIPSDPRDTTEPSAEDRREFIDLGYRWVVLRTDVLTTSSSRLVGATRAREVRQRLHELLGEPAVTGDGVEVFRLSE